LEALVYSHRAANSAVEMINESKFTDGIPEWDIKGTADPEEMVLITQSYKELQAIMSNYVGIVRSNIRLERALQRLQILNRETENMYRRTTLSTALCELRNLILVGYLIHWIPENFKEKYRLKFAELPLPVMSLVAVVFVFCIYQMVSGEMQPFIYFQF
jgi:L-aspartate oxidase